jgi:hypothetical protein
MNFLSIVLMYKACQLLSGVVFFKLIRSPGIDSKESIPTSLCSLAGRNDTAIPTRFLAPIECSKIPAQLVDGMRKSQIKKARSNTHFMTMENTA